MGVLRLTNLGLVTEVISTYYPCLPGTWLMKLRRQVSRVLYGSQDDLQVFKNAVKCVLTNKGFEIGTEKSRMILAKLLKWTENNEKAAAVFFQK